MTSEVPKIVDIRFEDHDDGWLIKIGPDWEPIVEEYYTNFEALKKTFITDPSGIPNKVEKLEDETSDSEGLDQPKFQVHGPTALLENRQAQIRLFDFIYKQLCWVGLWKLAQTEYDAQSELIEREEYKCAIIRQSAFFEDYLTFLCQLQFQELKAGVLSNNEFKMISQMGHTDRIRLASLLNAISDEEHGYLQQLAKRRNELAHNSWTDFSQEKEREFKNASSKVHKILNRLLDSAEEAKDQAPVVDITDIDFSDQEEEIDVE